MWNRIRCGIGFHAWHLEHRLGLTSLSFEDVANYRECQRPGCGVTEWFSEGLGRWMEGERQEVRR